MSFRRTRTKEYTTLRALLSTYDFKNDLEPEAVTIKVRSYSKKLFLGASVVVILFNWGKSLILASFSIGIIAQSSVL